MRVAEMLFGSERLSVRELTLEPARRWQGFPDPSNTTGRSAASSGGADVEK